MPNGAGIQAQLILHLPGVRSSQPVRMRVVHNHQVSPPADGFDMDTGPNAVPCRLLATCFKELNALGPNCRFSGYVSTFNTPGGWSGEVKGQLIGADLGSLTRESSTGVMTGTADITLLDAVFQRGRIDELSGRIECGPGTMGRGMLAALVEHLKLTPQTPITLQSPAFDHIGLDVRIDSRGVSIAGRCAGIPGAVAVAGGRAILSEPAQLQPVAALIQALVPANEVPVSATRQSASLARLLPIPDAKTN